MQYTYDNIHDLFNSILLPKNIGKYSKSARDNYESSITKMEYTLKNIAIRLNGGYAKSLPEIDENVKEYYNAVIDEIHEAWDTFAKKGEFNPDIEAVNSKFSKDTVEKFNTFNAKASYDSDFSNGDPKLVINGLKKSVKTLLKNGYSASGLNSKMKAEEEAKKPKMPDEVKYEHFDSFDPARMKAYKPNGRGEQVARTKFLDARLRNIYGSKNYVDKHPEILQYINEVFNEFDNVWFSYIGGKSDKLDFSKLDSIVSEWFEKSPFTKKFDTSMSRFSSGSATIYDCKESMQRMAKARDKFVSEVSGEKEDEYSRWEKSVDGILNDDGKPVLNTFLADWVDRIVKHYTNKETISGWEKEVEEYTSLIKDIENKRTEVIKNWKATASDSLPWTKKLYGYEDLNEYINLEHGKKFYSKLLSRVEKELKIVSMGEPKIRKMFKEQAAEVKKTFVTNVCSQSGCLKSGNFYWSKQNTGHLNGEVVGENGRFRVTSFFAGGYNIQELHVRTKITKLVER